MDSSTNKREGDAMKEYNMEASSEGSAGRSQIVSKTLAGFQWEVGDAYRDV
jgi:hypothetical protein